MPCRVVAAGRRSARGAGGRRIASSIVSPRMAQHEGFCGPPGGARKGRRADGPGHGGWSYANWADISGLVRAGRELERDAVHAPALSGRPRAVREDMPEMGVATGTTHLGAPHQPGTVLVLGYRRTVARGRK